ncbi:MAG: hypothetical protein Q8L85_05335 [Alphaproteobacteria bacterium]|nr:hypothetical protein [Alphaproteobacteria bacterium]
MLKYLKIALISTFFAFNFNIYSHAIGGKNVEEMSIDEIRQKGILKIVDKNYTVLGSGVLFEEGQGFLALTARHVIDSFNPQEKQFVVLGDQKREILKFYKQKTNPCDIAVLLLASPFKNMTDLPRLPSEQAASVGISSDTNHGYGLTTALDNPGILKDSQGIARKADIIYSSVDQILPEIREIYKSAIYNTLSHNDAIMPILLAHLQMGSSSLISVNISLPPTDCPNVPLIHKISQDQGVLLEEGKVLQSSDNFFSLGDSGSALIDKNNEIRGINSGCFESLWWNGISVSSTEPSEEAVKLISKTTIGRLKTNIFFLKKGRFHFQLEDYQNITKEDREEDVSGYSEAFLEDFRQFHTTGRSNLFLKMYAHYADEIPFLKEWFNKSAGIKTRFMTSVLQYKDWILRATDVALKAAKK